MNFRSFLCCVVTLIVSAGCGSGSGVRVEQAWVRGADSAAVTAAYFVLANEGFGAARLVAVSASCAATSEIHETRRSGGTASMNRLERVDVAPRSRVTFAPGGRHVMLISTLRRLQSGDTASVVLRFADGRSVTAVAEVRE